MLGSNQIAVWIEDQQRNHIKTVCVTRYTAADGWRLRKTSLPEWRKAANPAEMGNSEIDAVTGATPVKDSGCKVIWDFKDDNGNIVPDGIYRCYVEGTLYFYDHVACRGEINTAEGEITLRLEPEYTNRDSSHRNMISNVEIRYYPWYWHFIIAVSIWLGFVML